MGWKKRWKEEKVSDKESYKRDGRRIWGGGGRNQNRLEGAGNGDKYVNRRRKDG